MLAVTVVAVVVVAVAAASVAVTIVFSCFTVVLVTSAAVVLMLEDAGENVEVEGRGVSARKVGEVVARGAGLRGCSKVLVKRCGCVTVLLFLALSLFSISFLCQDSHKYVAKSAPTTTRALPNIRFFCVWLSIIVWLLVCMYLMRLEEDRCVVGIVMSEWSKKAVRKRKRISCVFSLLLLAQTRATRRRAHTFLCEISRVTSFFLLFLFCGVT